jgi:hypothetical protein
VDIVGSANPFVTTTGPADVVASLITVAADISAPTTYVFDISSVVAAGGTFYIRFAEVDNQGNLNFLVDDVTINGQVVCTLCGDPHLRSLRNGGAYTPHASVIPAVYNMVTHPRLQVNTLWDNRGYPQVVTLFGIRVRNPLKPKHESRIEVALIGSKAHPRMQVKVNGKSVRNNRTVNVFPDDPLFTTQFNVVRTSSLRTTIHTDLFDLFIELVTQSGGYFNLYTAQVNLELMKFAHGLVGQTAGPGIPYITNSTDPVAKYVQGTVDQYRVKDGLFGTDFHFNLYEQK